jgi:hypothetical protein
MIVALLFGTWLWRLQLNLTADTCLVEGPRTTSHLFYTLAGQPKLMGKIPQPPTLSLCLCLVPGP